MEINVYLQLYLFIQQFLLSKKTLGEKQAHMIKVRANSTQTFDEMLIYSRSACIRICIGGMLRTVRHKSNKRLIEGQIKTQMASQTDR